MVSDALYASPADIRNEINMQSTSDDSKLQTYIAAVSRMIDGYMGYREEGFQAKEVETYKIFSGFGRRYLNIPACLEVTSVALKTDLTQSSYDKVLSASEYVAFRGVYNHPNYNETPFTGILLTSSSTIATFWKGVSDQRFEFGDSSEKNSAKAVSEPNIQIGARWGYADIVPAPIRTATIMQSVRIYQRLSGGMADAIINDAFGMNRYMSELDKDVKVLLNMSGIRRGTFVGNR